jgi:hypothetical protein
MPFSLDLELTAKALDSLNVTTTATVWVGPAGAAARSTWVVRASGP